MTQATTIDRRPQTVAVLGTLLQLASFGVLLGVALWSKSDAIAAVARFVLSGVPVWLVLFLVFKQARRVESERLETAELQRARESGLTTAIFEVESEALLLEQARFQWMVRWLLPATTVAVTAYLLVGQFFAWGWPLGTAFDKDVISRTERPTVMMWFVVGVGFASFLYGRYTLALGHMREWKLLHAGAVWMAATALTCLTLAVVLMVGPAVDGAEPLLACVVRIVLVVLGIELAVNLVLDFYRPRTADELPRPAFDSRLLGLLSEPGGVAKSIADAVNYQFGFKVSSTWAYQLLQRWLFPIMVATAALVMLLTSVVIVDADELAVIERLGRPLGTTNGTSSSVGVGEKSNGILEPGMHFKWPHPFDVVWRVPVRRVRELVVGEATEKDDQNLNKAIVWTEAHDYEPELMLLVAASKQSTLNSSGQLSQTPSPLPSPSEGEGDSKTAAADPTQASESVPVSLLMVSVPISYRVKDIHAFLYNHADPIKLMECVAHQYLSEYAAGVDVDQLMGPGREQFNADLRKLIQRRLDELNVGVEIAFAGIRGAHPPEKEQVATAFQGVISAQIKQAATVHAAQGESQRILTTVAGTESAAKRLDEAIKERDRLSSGSAAIPEALAAAEERVRDLLLGNPAKNIEPLRGRAAAILSRARADSREWISEESTKRAAFAADLTAYRAAPELFARRKVLEIYRGLDSVRKYLIIGDPSNVVIEYETTEQGGLDRVLGEAVDPSRKRQGP